MDTAGLALLRAVLIVGTTHLTSAWIITNDIYGEIEYRLLTTETFPWQRFEMKSESKSEKTRIPVWNNAVELKGCWTNYYERFKLSCGRMKNADGLEFSHRAILHDHEEKRSLITWDVLSCNVNLLNSVSVVPGGWWRDDRYYIYTINTDRSCRMEDYRRGSKSWELKKGEPKDHECPSPYRRTERENSIRFGNGWAVNSILTDGKDCR